MKYFHTAKRGLKTKRRPVLGVTLTALVACATTVGLGLAGPASAARSAAAGTPFKIGYVWNASGPLAPYSVGVYSFFDAEIQYVNSHGGVQGHKIDVIALDAAGNAGQQLLDYETLWSQDNVAAIVDVATYTPWAYIKANNIPVISTSGGSGSRGFSSYYPTWFPLGSLSPTWNSQAAYWSVKIEHKDIKVVELEYNPVVVFGPWLSFEENYWTKLGATTVLTYADQGTSANCTPLVLSMKAAGVQYLDLQGPEFPACIEAEDTIGWRPPLGEGAPETSQIGEAELLGKTLVGVIAGSPNALYTGAPIVSTPGVASRTYVGIIKKYDPQYANYSFLNGTGQLDDYTLGQLVSAGLNAALTKFHRVTPATFVKGMQSLKNWSSGGLDPPVASFAPNCRTGGDGTIWGYWHYNPTPTAAKPSMYMVPTSGPNWVTTRTFLGYGKCYLTQLSNEIFPNG